MRAAIALYLPWLLSVLTLWMTFLAGERRRSAWVVALCNQSLWLLWTWASASWGLLPLNAGLWVLYVRNYWKWRNG